MILTKNRAAAVSGKFYPEYYTELKKTLGNLFYNAAQPKIQKPIKALIVPHAGYIFSGEVAASAYAQIDRETQFENIFILAPSHYTSFNAASIYDLGNYETPLGEVYVNLDIARDLIRKHKFISYNKEAHKFEHSIEVQLPFIKYWFKKNFKIVPILIGTQNEEELKKLAEVLRPYFGKNNLFVISSDFSHFPNYEGALASDKNMENAILKNSTKALNEAVALNDSLNIENLSTSACGFAAIKTLIYITEGIPNIEIDKIKYMNSGDSRYGDHNRVVGYLSFALSISENNDSEFLLSADEKKQLLQVARQAIKNMLETNVPDISNDISLNSNLQTHCGVFVSIHKGEELRGCVGRFEAEVPLYILVQKMAIAAAFSDSRFAPLKFDEFEDINLEISVLSPLKSIKSPSAIEIGKHGIYMRQGFSKGTLLPQVATNNNWSVEEFLGYCAKNKAGLGWEGWKKAELFTYTADVFSE